MNDICVVHLVRAVNGLEPFIRFLESYKKNPGGIAHELLIVFKGFEDEDLLNEFREQLTGIQYKEFSISDEGFDLTAYLNVAQKFNYKFFCFLNSNSVILDPSWLAKLYRYAKLDEVGIVGATGSYQSLYTYHLPKNYFSWQEKKPFSLINCWLKIQQYLQLARIAISYRVYFDPFPNHHIRTNAFMMRQDELVKIVADRLLTKLDAYKLESGKDSITNQVIRMGKKPLVVGKDGISYEKEQWFLSDTFWRANQKNLLIADNQTRMYEDFPIKSKSIYSWFAWGDGASFKYRKYVAMKYKKTIALCTACGSKAKRLFRTSDINQKMADREFDYYRCNSCGIIFIDQIPEDLSLFYGNNYSAYQQPDFLQDSQIAEQEKEKLEVVKEHSLGKNMLEIGPGSGAFSYFAKSDGYEIDVIEMDKDCCEYLKNTVGVNTVIHSVDIPTAIMHVEKKYDVIVLWHVLEHLINPWQVLEAISKALTPRGIVVIATPNPESIQFRLFQKYWKHTDAPRHLSLIPMTVLKNKAVVSGLQPIKITTLDKPSAIFHSYGWWIESLKNYLTEKPNSIITKMLRKPRIQYVVTFFLYKYLGSSLERKEGNGAAYTAIFTKNNSGSSL